MQNNTHIINPITNKLIKIGGATYKKLIKDGVLDHIEPKEDKKIDLIEVKEKLELKEEKEDEIEVKKDEEELLLLEKKTNESDSLQNMEENSQQEKNEIIEDLLNDYYAGKIDEEEISEKIFKPIHKIVTKYKDELIEIQDDEEKFKNKIKELIKAELKN